MSTPTDPTHDQPELPAEVREAIAEAIGVFFEQTDDAEHCEHRICAVLAPLWPKQPQPSADVEKLADECVRKCFEAELFYKTDLFLEVKKNEVSAILARAFAEKDAEIARLKDKHQQSPEYLSMLQAMLDMKARAERAEAVLNDPEALRVHVMRNHPGYALESTEFIGRLRGLAERTERAEAAAHDYHKKACDIADQRDRAESERDQLRAEVEQWKTTAAKDREENVDMRNEIADLRAQLNELQRINQADYTEAGWQRARELETQLASLEASERKAHYEREDARQALELCRTELAAAQQFNKRLADAAEEVLSSYILTKRVEEGHPCPENMVICTTLRAAINAARKESAK